MSPRRLSRRLFIALGLLGGAALAATTTGCKRSGGAAEGRCAHCGMKVDKESGWKVDLVTKDGKTTSYDTPRCAFAALRGGAVSLNSVMRVRDYYDRSEHLADEMRFVVGSDVVGPMGKDLVPLTPAHVESFLKSHGSEKTKALGFPEVTRATLDTLE